MSEEIHSILADGQQVSKARLREWLARHAMPVHAAEAYGLQPQLTASPVPSPEIQAANHSAIMAALEAACLQGGGEVVLPPGFIHINDTIEIGPDAQTARLAKSRGGQYAVRLRGMGREATNIVQNHPTKPLLRVLGRGSQRTQFCLHLSAMRLLGRGAPTRGNLIELIGFFHHVVENVWLQGTGGRAIFTSFSERNVFRDITIYECRQAAVFCDYANETYLLNFLPMECGYTQDPIVRSARHGFSVNAGPDGNIRRSGRLYQEKRASVHIESSQNFRWIGGSIKNTYHLSGVKVRGTENVQIDQVYFESFPNVAPAANPSVIFGGAMERTTIEHDIAADETTIQVADSSWFPRVYSDARAFDYVENHEGKYYALYNPRNPRVYEIVLARGFVGNVLHVMARGVRYPHALLGRRRARGWPKGTVLMELAFAISDLCLHNNHLESFRELDRFRNVRLVADAVRGHTNGQVIVGFTRDAFCSAPNFPSGDLGNNCILELSGHNRVRGQPGGREQTLAVEAHNRAYVHLSHESELGGVEVIKATESRDWGDVQIQIARTLSSERAVTTREPGGFHTLRRDLAFNGAQPEDVSATAFKYAFQAPLGAVAEVNLYTVDREAQGRDCVASFFLDLQDDAPPLFTARYIRGRSGFVPVVRVVGRSPRGPREVWVGLRAPGRPQIIMLRLDITAICGWVTAQGGTGEGLSTQFELVSRPALP